MRPGRSGELGARGGGQGKQERWRKQREREEDEHAILFEEAIELKHPFDFLDGEAVDAAETGMHDRPSNLPCEHRNSPVPDASLSHSGPVSVSVQSALHFN